MKMSGSIAGGGNRMDPGECLLCKSKMREGTTEFVARVGEQVVVIKNIPGFVCPNCDEAYYLDSGASATYIFSVHPNPA